MKKLDRIIEVKGMAFAWCDVAVSAELAADGLAFDILGDCKTTLDGIIYSLRTVRFLMPSVHRLSRGCSPLEIQFIHNSSCGNRLVLIALFREGEPDADVHTAIVSLALEQATVRLIDLIPLGRRFFVHEASDSAGGRTSSELHMVSVTEVAISFELLAALNERLTPQRVWAQL